MKTEVLVLGAGIVGISSALHLQEHGHEVVLVDRRSPGEEASYGNAGLIQSASVEPYGFPRDWQALLKYASNQLTSLHYDARSLPSYLPFLARYWWESAPKRLAQAGQDMLPLISSSVREHQYLMAKAGVEHLARPSGWLEAYRTPALFEAASQAAIALSKNFSLQLEILDAKALTAFSSLFRGNYTGAIHWLDPMTVSSPGDLTKGYAALFQKEGGRVLRGDAMTLQQTVEGWTVQTADGELLAKTVVLALGASSDTVYRRLGYRIPLMPKRGYHMHYATSAEDILPIPIIDIEEGYAIAPMKEGIRLSTGVELATADRPTNTIQLDRAERCARHVLKLGARVQKSVWHGMRPCTPDMRPIIGRAARHDGLWFSFGHNHHGFTLGPGSGRLLAEMISGVVPFVDPHPYRAERFG